MMQKFFVSVFVKDKYVNSYFSENLDDLITIKALHKNCEIFIFDLEDFVLFTKEQVETEIQKSCQRWKKSMERLNEPESIEAQEVEQKPKQTKSKKYWERSVMCVATGQVFSSIRQCSERTGIPYMTIVNCIKNGNATRGLHFVNAQNAEGENPES